MSVDELLRRIDERLERLERHLERSVYDAAALRRMGVPKHRAAELLRTRGTGTGPNGRRLITRTALEQALTPEGSKHAHP